MFQVFLIPEWNKKKEQSQIPSERKFWEKQGLIFETFSSELSEALCTNLWSDFKQKKSSEGRVPAVSKSLESPALFHFVLLFLQNRSFANVSILPETEFLI